jgi:hypothetical protein
MHPSDESQSRCVLSFIHLRSTYLIVERDHVALSWFKQLGLSVTQDLGNYCHQKSERNFIDYRSMFDHHSSGNRMPVQCTPNESAIGPASGKLLEGVAVIVMSSNFIIRLFCFNLWWFQQVFWTRSWFSGCKVSPFSVLIIMTDRWFNFLQFYIFDKAFLTLRSKMNPYPEQDHTKVCCKTRFPTRRQIIIWRQKIRRRSIFSFAFQPLYCTEEHVMTRLVQF